MLQYRTIDPETLGILKKLMRISELQDFFLAGGTALALQIGHRISIDLDLFTQNDFDSVRLFAKLNAMFNISDKTEDKNTLNINILSPEKTQNPVKVDLIKYSYPLINPIQEIDQIRLSSVEDIIPMKLSALAGRRFKKDFYDIYFLLKSYSFEEMFSFFEQKFSNINKFHIIKSLAYFEDAELQPDPQTIERHNWEEIKKDIIDKTNKYIRS